MRAVLRSGKVRFGLVLMIVLVVAAVFAPFYEMLIWDAGPEAGVITVMSLLLIWRHAPNISKLLAGTESKLFAKAPAAGARRAR